MRRANSLAAFEARKARYLFNALCVVGIVVSVGVLVALNVSDWQARNLAERSISKMESVCEQQTDDERAESLRQALLYNACLAGTASSEEARDVLPYDEQLLYREEPMMAFIEISKIAVKLPIYHGVGEDVLMAGVGHLEGSSLPVGGENSHCVLMGHSGMRNAQMFDGLERLARGDVLIIKTLGNRLAYKVCDMRVVLPDQVEERMSIVPGSDLVTLVTCTPYGVNSHRLLVRARRCTLEEGAKPQPPSVDAYVNRRSLPLAVAMGILAAPAALGAAAHIGRHMRRRRKTVGQHAVLDNKLCRLRGGERKKNHVKWKR